MKKLLMIVALLLSANTNANMKASVGVDMSSTDRSSTVNSERNIHVRGGFGYNIPLDKSLDLGIGYSVVTNGDTRSDLYLNINKSPTLKLQIGPTFNVSNYRSNLGLSVGYELQVDKDLHLNLNTNAFRRLWRSVNGKLIHREIVEHWEAK